MQVSYKKLWKLLIDRDMRKQDLKEKAGISKGVLLRSLKIKLALSELQIS